jgi:hypothetical protein
LPGCNTQEDATPPPSTGQESSFELTGDVAAVDIEDVDFGLSIPPDGVNVRVEAGITVNLTVDLESIDDATAQLCGLKGGTEAIVVVDDNTDLDFDRPRSELGTLEDESIRAIGIAKERAALQSPGDGATEFADKCELKAEAVALVEETTPEPNTSPTPGL